MASPGTAAIDPVETAMERLGRRARLAAAELARSDGAVRDGALRAGAHAIRAGSADILAANAKDLAASERRAAFTDRLRLDPARIEAMARGLETVAALPDPVGAVIDEWTRPNGLAISRVRVPLGVIGIIYESRPNVTADAGALCLKSANAAILRGGAESFHSSRAIAARLAEGLRTAGLPETAIQLVPTRDRAAVGEMLAMAEYIDVVIPRGGPSLIERVRRESRIPVIAHLDGNCHVYLDRAAEPVMAREIVMNAKMRRTGICGAAETLLVDQAAAEELLPPILSALADAGCELRGCPATRRLDARVRPATVADWDTEYLDAILAVRIVDGVAGAIDHIGMHGSGHTEAIVTADGAAARRFLDEVDSAIVMWNASTQFADGGEFGMGAEIGISTGRLHARGPVGAEQLTTYKYVVRGAGQVRP